MLVYWKTLELHTRKLLLGRLYIFVHLQAVVTLARCLEVEGPQHGTQYGGVEEEGPTT